MGLNWQRSQGVSAHEKRQQHAEVAAYRAKQAAATDKAISHLTPAQQALAAKYKGGKTLGQAADEVKAHKAAAQGHTTKDKPHGSGDNRARDENGRYI